MLTVVVSVSAALRFLQDTARAAAGAFPVQRSESECGRRSRPKQKLNPRRNELERPLPLSGILKFAPGRDRIPQSENMCNRKAYESIATLINTAQTNVRRDDDFAALRPRGTRNFVVATTFSGSVLISGCALRLPSV